MKQNETITANQKRIIRALLESRSITVACEKTGIARATVYRWMREEPFKKALKVAERELSESIARSLLAGVETALEVLYSIMVEGDENNVRRNACNDWLSLTLRYREYADILPRIERLEELENAIEPN